MRKLTRIGLCALIAAPALVACSTDSGEPAAQSTPEPTTHVLEVEIFDATPLEVYFNFDDQQCTATNIADAFQGQETPPVSIVVRDADGTIVASEEAPAQGGELVRGEGCRVPVAVTVPTSDFYEVTVTAGTESLSESVTVERSDDEAGQHVEVRVLARREFGYIFGLHLADFTLNVSGLKVRCSAS